MFLGDNPEPIIVSVSLHHSFVQTFLDEQFDEKGRSGIYDAMNKNLPPSNLGKFLGFEVLGYNYGSFHSWLCHNLEKEIKENFNITANDKGLFKDLQDATQVASYYSLDETGTEPVQWLPWLLLQYAC